MVFDNLHNKQARQVTGGAVAFLPSIDFIVKVVLLLKILKFMVWTGMT